MKIVVLTPRLEARLRWITERDRPGDIEQKCLVTYTICPICGFAQWSCSQQSLDGFKVAINNDTFYLDDYNCTQCTTIRLRAPEVFSWVLGVVLHQHDQLPADLPKPEVPT